MKVNLKIILKSSSMAVCKCVRWGNRMFDMRRYL
jgi:hypothetical protein